MSKLKSLRKASRKITFNNILVTILILVTFSGFYYSSPTFSNKINYLGVSYSSKVIGEAEYQCAKTKPVEKMLTGKEYEDELKKQEDMLALYQELKISYLYDDAKKRLDEFKIDHIATVSVPVEESAMVDVVDETMSRFGIPYHHRLSLTMDKGYYSIYASQGYTCKCANPNPQKEKDAIECKWQRVNSTS